MKNSENNNHEIDRILEMTRHVETPPHIEQRLRERLAAFRERLDARERSTATAQRQLFSPTRKLAWACVVTVACVAAAVVASFLLTAPRNGVYAAAMEALKSVKTVRISGWSLYPEQQFYEELDPSQHYPLEIWEWVTENRRYRQYYREGHVTEWDDGERRYRYHEQRDELYVSLSTVSKRPMRAQFEKLAAELGEFVQRGYTRTDLGERTIGESQAKGVRLEMPERARKEAWFDTTTNLPIEATEYVWKDGAWLQLSEGTIVYDQEVPIRISGYAPPKAKQTHYDSSIDPEFERYNLHLRRLAARYHEAPLPDRMELAPREVEEKMESYYPGRLPDIKTHWVRPIHSSLGSYLRTGKWAPHGTLRMPPDLQNIKLNHDLIVKYGVSTRERNEFVLNSLGLEVVEVTEDRKVWVAHYDGRPLKPWEQVKAPVPREDPRAPIGPGMASVFGPFSMVELFEGFAYGQDYDLTATGLVIVDETGLATVRAEGDSKKSREAAAVSNESPRWKGDESVEIARRWFAEQFGVTFTEDTRPMTVYVVRKRNAS